MRNVRPALKRFAEFLFLFWTIVTGLAFSTDPELFTLANCLVDLRFGGLGVRFLAPEDKLRKSVYS